jgi:hypothetical protein
MATKNDHTQVRVATIPNCDVCAGEGKQTLAYADAKLSIGPWGYVCLEHFSAYGCSLGLGKGQRLIHEDAPESLGRCDPPSEANGWACQICGQPGGH